MGQSLISVDKDLIWKSVWNAVHNYGTSSISFLTLYNGYKYWLLNDIIIPYCENKYVLAGAGNPLCAPSLTEKALQLFKEESEKKGKVAIIFPASKAVAELACSCGYAVIPLGSEPWIDLQNFKHSKDELLDRIQVAKRLAAKDVKVENFIAKDLDFNNFSQCKKIMAEWLNSRKSAPLAFLNRLDPWLMSEQKRYFKISLNNTVLGFLSAVPIPVRGGWYLVDILRLKNAPPGTTELLIINAIEFFHNEGAKEITLGMSPLANLLPLEGSTSKHSMYMKIAPLIFNYANIFYNFKTLYEYKNKFAPSYWEPQYLLCSSGSFALKESIGLTKILYPNGVSSSLSKMIFNILKLQSVFEKLQFLLSKKIITKNFPTSWLQLVYRIKVTIALVLAQLVMFAGTTNADIGVLLIIGGPLEIMLGGSILLSCYLAGTLLANPIILLLGDTILKNIFPMLNLNFMQSSFTNYNLGIFSLLGSLVLCTRFTKSLLFLIIILSMSYIIFISHNLLDVAHLVALALGLICTRFLIK
ncbi:MAG: DUF2156 domain-containing protein [Oligoflexia bacterium]|nr:DUF2156 domain-containing protein [Oligoflexia bacterium]